MNDNTFHSPLDGNTLKSTPAKLSGLLEDMFTLKENPGFAEYKKAAAAWNDITGDKEKKHTKALFLADGKKPFQDPELIVYVDSHACIADFSTNADLYLERLYHQGLRLSGLRFCLSSKK